MRHGYHIDRHRKGVWPSPYATDAPVQDAEIELDELQSLLASAPGVVSIHQIKSHPRGGYVAVIDFAMTQLDPWIVHLEARGWMSVM